MGFQVSCFSPLITHMQLAWAHIKDRRNHCYSNKFKSVKDFKFLPRSLLVDSIQFQYPFHGIYCFLLVGNNSTHLNACSPCDATLHHWVSPKFIQRGMSLAWKWQPIHKQDWAFRNAYYSIRVINGQTLFFIFLVCKIAAINKFSSHRPPKYSHHQLKKMAKIFENRYVIYQ